MPDGGARSASGDSSGAIDGDCRAFMWTRASMRALRTCRCDVRCAVYSGSYGRMKGRLAVLGISTLGNCATNAFTPVLFPNR